MLFTVKITKLLLKDRFLKKMLLKRQNPSASFRKTVGSNHSFTLIENNLSFFQIAKFEFKVTEHYSLWAKCTQLWNFNPRPTKPFFVTWFTKGDGYHPPMNLKLTGPKYDCLVPWYRVGSPLSIDTKIMKIGQGMTSQWRFQSWPDSKSWFSVKID